MTRTDHSYRSDRGRPSRSPGARGARWSIQAIALALALGAFIPPDASFATEPDREGSTTARDGEASREGAFEGSSATDETFSPPGITGDLGGPRPWLFEHGIELSIDLTQGVQGVLDGGFDEEAEYLGSSEVLLDVNTEKLGLWPGGFARVAGEGRFGSDVVSEAGSLSPVNNDALFPADPDRVGKDLFAMTEMTATQFLAPWIGFYGGLINTTSGDANEYAGFVRSNEYFQNASLLVNMVSLRIVPSVALGGGMVVIPFDWLIGSVTFIGTEETAGSDPFDVSDGVTFVTEWTAKHAVLNVPLRHVVGFGVGFNNDFFRLGELPRIELPPGTPPQLRFSTKDESWAFWYNGQLDAWTHPEDEKRKAGLFLRFGYADDETNPIQWDLAVGVGGTGVFDLRPNDRFGIGVYHLEPSDNFPLPALGIDDETGYEMFYNAQIMRGVELTFDLQYIDSGFGRGLLVTDSPDNAWVGGIRLRLVL